MGFPNNQSNPGGAIPVYTAYNPTPITPPTPFPATIAGNATYDSGIITKPIGFANFAVTAQLDQTGNLELNIYLDAAGTIQINNFGQAMTANTLAIISANLVGPYMSYRVTIQNTSGSAANLTNAGILAG